MFECFTFVSSVIKLIYSKQLVLLYTYQSHFKPHKHKEQVLYSQDFLKYVLTRILQITTYNFHENFFLGSSVKIFKIILLDNVL
jgi:hypothetical protein